MSTFKERQKAEAVKRMRLMGLREDAIQEFEQNGTLHLSYEAGLPDDLPYWEMRMIKTGEKRRNALFYLVIRTSVGDAGMQDAFLFVSRAENRWPVETIIQAENRVPAFILRHKNLADSGLDLIKIHATPDGVIVRDL